jgi:hypothetical protein
MARMHRQLPRLTECLNCGEPVHENYCGRCGQENEDRTTGLKPLLSDFLSEIASFDSKLVRTIKPLIFQPGRLTNAYNEGKRVSYLSPLKMYLVASVIFFITLAYKLPVGIIKTDQAPPERQVGTTVKTGSSSPDPENMEEFERWARDPEIAKKQSRFERYLTQKVLHVKEDPKAFIARMLDNVPKMMFVLLPFFALILKLIYIRSRRLYVEHLIFALHCHAFVFLVIAGSQLTSYWLVALGAVIWMSAYLFFAMVRVYRQSFMKTLLKFGILSATYMLVLGLSLLGVLFVTFATI